ncbi:MAG: ABC transporter permease, partial [Sinomicrobium sp.]|nr:ABC transporter permease [Sinomicrobium sp.]
MMWQIIKNEWRYLRRSRLLFGMNLGFVLVLSLSVILGNYQNQKQQKTYEAARQHIREKWEGIGWMNPHGAAHFGTYIFKPVNLLNSLDEGVNSTTGNVLRVEGHVQNEMVHAEAAQMQMVSRFGKLKSSLLLKYVVPLLLIFLAFNAVNSEKQSGRLKLLIVQGSRPAHLILGKTFSVWSYGIALLALVLLVYGILNIWDLDSVMLKRALFFFASYALYYFVITGLTVFFTARWKNATVSLTAMLGIWILWTVFL